MQVISTVTTFRPAAAITGLCLAGRRRTRRRKRGWLSLALLCPLAAACAGSTASTSSPPGAEPSLLSAPDTEGLLADLIDPRVSYACTPSAEDAVERVQCARRDLPGDAASFSVLMVESGPAEAALRPCAFLPDIEPAVFFGPGGASTALTCLLPSGTRYLKADLLEKVGAPFPATGLDLQIFAQRYVEALD